jgi:hypothetical protein
MRLLAAAVLIAASAGCGGATGSPSESPATIAPSASPPAIPRPSEVGSVGPFSPAGCPESEAAFCAPAAAVAEAIVAGDTPAIVGLSRPDVFRCEDLEASIFIGCESADVLEGHPIGTADSSIDVLPASAYREELEATKAAIDPSYTDDAGTGEARVLGTSACGPDDPTRRSYYVAWTAAVRAGSGDAERVIGLYEYTFRDDRWMVGILYLDTVAGWRARHDEPIRDVACDVSAWGAG